MSEGFSTEKFAALLESERTAYNKAQAPATGGRRRNASPFEAVRSAQQTWLDRRVGRLAYEREGIIVRGE